jgi:hypothetical protein
MKQSLRIAIVAVMLSVGATAQTTWNQPAFTNQATSGCSPVLRNINQSAHWLSYSVSGTISAGLIYLQGSGDSTHWTTISNLGVLSSGVTGSVQAGGYYPEVEACIEFLTGTGQVSAVYSASTGAIPTPGNAGYATNDTPVTFVPISTVDTYSSLKSTAYLLQSGGAILFGSTVYNPNSGVVYVAFSAASTPFAGSGAGSFMIAVPPSGSLVISLPPQGIYFVANFYVGCSTSPTSAVDPTSACVVSSYWKTINGGAVPNGVQN